MDQEKIQKFEDEIQKIFSENTEEGWRDFWFVHVKPVIECGKKMADKYGADKEVVWLGAILHDLGQLDGLKNHNEIGAEKAKNILKEKYFSDDVVKKVSDVILTHSVNEYVPQNLEQKILASADAICHFTTPFYLWLARVSKKSFEDVLLKIQEKIEKDFNDKIFFDEEREMIRPQYEIFEKWFGHKI
jgi:putative nucleotidyltransferase with HDIG domain